MKNQRIVIVGGGVAGSTLAIRLAGQNRNVTVVEKEKFPRHKLCGEFVSPECLSHFESIGVMDSIMEAGASPILETRFFAQSGRSISIPSKWFQGGNNGALGISRAELDLRLLGKARKLGVEVFEGIRINGINVDNNRIRGITGRDKYGDSVELKGDLCIDATGRSRVLGRLVEKTLIRKPGKRKITHLAFKSHLGNVELENGVCEIYFFRGGYGGLNYVENGIANLCFMVDSGIAREFGCDAETIVEEVIFKNRRAGEALIGSGKKSKWLAVPIEQFGRQPLDDINNLVSIGDAAAFIDPFTGSGMLMALESSRLLAEIIEGNPELSNGELIKREFEARHVAATRIRLLLCSVLRNLSSSQRLVNLTFSAVSLNRRFLHRFAALTRPA